MKARITKIEGNEIEFMEEGAELVRRLPLADWVKPEYVRLGDAEISELEGKVSFCQMKDKAPEKPGATGSTSAPANKKWEDDIVSFETLLTAAHKKAKDDGNNLNIKTTIVRGVDGAPLIEMEKKFAFFKARVFITDKEGKELCRFEGHGDATLENVTGTHIKPHFIRMAETRAIVRALRWYTNNGCAEEEK